MLSLRNRNMIVVTDAKVTKIKWWKIGPFMRQHDPDWEKGGKITVFDNHSDESLDGSRAGGSRIWQIDPATGAAVTLYGGRADQFMYSPERSTHQTQPDGNIMITEAQSGRAFEVTPAGKIVWEYVNRYDRDRVTWLHDAEAFDPVLLHRHGLDLWLIAAGQGGIQHHLARSVTPAAGDATISRRSG